MNIIFTKFTTFAMKPTQGFWLHGTLPKMLWKMKRFFVAFQFLPFRHFLQKIFIHLSLKKIRFPTFNGKVTFFVHLHNISTFPFHLKRLKAWFIISLPLLLFLIRPYFLLVSSLLFTKEKFVDQKVLHDVKNEVKKCLETLKAKS